MQICLVATLRHRTHQHCVIHKAQPSGAVAYVCTFETARLFQQVLLKHVLGNVCRMLVRAGHHLRKALRVCQQVELAKHRTLQRRKPADFMRVRVSVEPVELFYRQTKLSKNLHGAGIDHVGSGCL